MISIEEFYITEYRFYFGLLNEVAQDHRSIVSK